MVLVGSGEDAAPPETLRFVRADVAIMVVSGVVTLPGQRGAGPDHDSVQTFVLAKDGGDWRVAAFHNTRREGRSPSGLGVTLP